jgi:crotonobetainyl-CoA:carnitine CoA-transferase CaiB-like acyl-CoA transferase
MSQIASDRPVQGRDPLAGIRVLDFTIVMSGPMCTRMLADAGADVIKIEPPSGDVVRQRPPHRGGISTYYASMNCGKRSVVLDLRNEEGRRLARELASQSDIVVENFRPGVMKRLGLDYEGLSQKNPRLIYCSISGFGQSGPMASAPAYAPVIHAASGYENAYTEYQRGTTRPANNGIFIADVLGAAHAASAIQLALFDRERTGLGQHIDLALMDSVLGMLIYEMQAAQFPPDRPRQVYEPVRSLDGYVMVAAVTPKNLEVLFDVIGYPQGKQDPRFATVRSKEENGPALLEIIEAWTSKRSGEECERVLMQAGVPCSRYRTVAQAMADPQIKVREMLVELGRSEERFQVANPPFKLSRSRTHARPLLAELGEHTEDVLNEVLALTPGELAGMRDKGVFGSH